MRQLSPCLLLFLAAGVSVTHALSSGWSPQSYPNPATDPEACGRQAQSWICDPDSVLSYNSRDVVEGIIKAIATGDKPFVTRPCGDAGDVGPQVAVALMKSFDPKLLRGRDVELVAASFATKLHDRWGVGHAQCDDGALLLLSVSDRQVYISRGSGAAKYLTDLDLDDIISNMKPLLRSGRYEAAIEQAVLDIGKQLSAPPKEPHSPFLGWAITAMVVLPLGIGLTWLIRNGNPEQRAFNACKAKLDKLRRDQAALRAGQTYNPTSCPICLEDFEQPAAAAAAAPGAAPQPAAPSAPEAPNDRDVDGRPPPGSDEDVDGRPPGSPARQPLLGLQQRVHAMSSGSGGAGAGAAPAPAPAPAPGPAPAPAPSRKPLILPCKHQFCESCITEWVAMRKLNCPVCRKPIDEGPGDSRRPPPPRPPCQGGAEEQQEQEQEQETFQRAYRGPYRGFYDQRYRQRPYNRQDMMRDELLFRLAMMRRRYPQYIDDGLVNQWSDDVAAGREVSPSALNSFQLRDPAVRAHLAHSGSHGSGSGFGGGSSSGGGRGSSW